MTSLARHFHRTVMSLACSLLGPVLLHGQTETGVLRGTVVSESGEVPIPGALVALDAGVRATADHDGVFVLRDVRAGPYRIAAVAPGCHAGLGRVVVAAGTETDVRVVVPLPPDAQAVLEAWTMGNRSRGETVKVMTGQEIRRRNLRRIEDAISILVPGMVGQQSAEAGSRQRLQARGAPTVAGPGEPLVVVDGVRLPGRPSDALASINPEDVERIEVTRGATGGWQYGLQGANGVVRITTRDGFGAFASRTPPEACHFSFPR